MKKIISFILSLTIIFTLAGCSDNESFVVSLELDNKVVTLDPQLATTITDKLLIKNLYEGLLREDENKNIVCGAAKSYDISENGLTYKFILRDDLLWSDGTNLTAYDFEFGFKRALSPITKAPYSYLLSDVSSYEAIDKKTFVVTLKNKNDNFIKTLCKSICMPCNENFFNNSKGKYGLDEDFILTNGSFFLKKWTTDGEYNLRISKSPNYNGNFISKVSALNVSIGDESERQTKIEKNYIDFGFVNYSYANFKSENAYYYSNFNTTYILLINNSGLLKNINTRIAVEKSIHRTLIKNNLPDCFLDANNLIPFSIKENNPELKDKIANIKAFEYNPSEAGEYYRQSLKELKNESLSGLNIIYPKDENIKILASTLAETWQQTINGYINIKEDSISNIYNSISSNQFDFAIIPINAENNDIFEFFNEFNKFNCIDNKIFNNELNKIKNSKSNNELLNNISSLLNLISKNHNVIPIVNGATVFAYSSDYKVPNINPENGYIDFSFIEENK